MSNDITTTSRDLSENANQFELMQRQAKMFSVSTMVPKEFQGNISNCFIAIDMANRTGVSVMMVMQNLYVVHGRPGWSSQFLIATINASGRFSPLRYSFVGEKGKPSYGCFAVTTELATGEVLEGSIITLAMAEKEGWSTKNGSKWLTMPEQMLRYRAASFFVRAFCPELSMGLHSADEIEDSQPQEVERVDVRRIDGKSKSDLLAKLLSQRSESIEFQQDAEQRRDEIEDQEPERQPQTSTLRECDTMLQSAGIDSTDAETAAGPFTYVLPDGITLKIGNGLDETKSRKGLAIFDAMKPETPQTVREMIELSKVVKK
jgi:hypothetical protein